MEMMVGCVPVVEGEKIGFKPYKGSTKARCPQCDREVWLGPEQKKKTDEGFKIICLVCAMTGMKPGESLPIVPLTDKKMGD